MWLTCLETDMAEMFRFCVTCSVLSLQSPPLTSPHQHSSSTNSARLVKVTQIDSFHLILRRVKSWIVEELRGLPSSTQKGGGGDRSIFTFRILDGLLLTVLEAFLSRVELTYKCL